MVAAGVVAAEALPGVEARLAEAARAVDASAAAKAAATALLFSLMPSAQDDDARRRDRSGAAARLLEREAAERSKGLAGLVRTGMGLVGMGSPI